MADLFSNSDFFSDEEKEELQKKKTDRSLETTPEEDLFARPQESETAQPDQVTEEPLEESFVAPQEQEAESPAPLEEEQSGDDFATDYQRDLNLNEELDSAPQEEPYPEMADEEEEEFEEEYDQPAVPDYVDEKQEKLNYRPLIIGAIVVVLLIVGGIAVKTFFFGQEQEESAQVTKEESPKEVTEEEKAAQPAKSPEELARENKWKTVARQTNLKLNFVQGLLTAVNKTSKARLSSMLLYGQDVMLEVFTPDRTALAKARIALKDAYNSYGIRLTSVTDRPAQQGVIGLFTLKLVDTGSGSQDNVDNPLASPSQAREWLNYLAQSQGARLMNFKADPGGTQDGLTVYTLRVTVNGSLPACEQFIQRIAQSNKNIAIHKLTLNARDQKTFSSKKYQLRLVMRLFS